MDLHCQHIKLFLISDLCLLTSGLCLLASVLCPLTSVLGQTGSIFVDENHNGHKIFGLPTPSSSDEAATKGYADSIGGGGGGSVSDTAFGASWNGVTTTAPSKNALYDWAHLLDTNDNGKVNVLDMGAGIVQTDAGGVVSAITVGSGLSFTGGTLSATGGGSGTVTTTGTPATGNLTKFSGATSITNGDLTGDVTTSGALATTIANNAVSLGQMAQVATDSILGRATSGSGNVEVLTALPFAFTGDVTRPIDSNALSIANSAVTYSKIQNVSANSKLLGSSATGSGAPPSEITLGTNLSMSGSTLNATGGGGGTIASTSDILKGDGSGNAVAFGSATSGKVLKSNGTTFVASTETYAAPGTSGNVLTSDGTNWTSAASVGGGNVSNSGTPASGQVALWTDATHIKGDTGITSSGTGATATLSANFINAASAFTIGGSSGTSGKVLQSNGGSGYVGSTMSYPTSAGTNGQLLVANASNVIFTTPTFPTGASPTAGKIMQADGTNWIASLPLYPTSAGTAGYSIRSDGSNFASYPKELINSSVTSQSPSASEVYLTGSNVVVAAGDFKAKGQYRCVFDVTKSAGTGAIVLLVRVGVNGTTADTTVLTFTFGAGTSVADTGIFEIIVTWRTVGSGTSAVVQGICKAQHNLSTTGLFSDAAAWTIVATTSSGFASNTATNIGVSFNGNTAFAGTITLVQASLLQ